MNNQKIKNIINNKTILITGGTGSFGRAFVKHILAKYSPKSIRIYSRDELKQYEMKNDLNDDKRLRFLIGDVRDYNRLKRACEEVDVVIHAAALKQVPTCEYNPIEAIKTNINGAVNVIESCLDNNVKYTLALSTDKAVNPINLYGATKLCSDKLFVQANSYSGSKRRCKFSVIRYGNVMASRGSVIPKFKKQIKLGKKITITDKNMTRFWITIEQAVNFVLSSMSIMKGGEIFVPKLPSMKITDLAKAIDPKCEFKIIGIRPGEKIDEYLISKEEGRNTRELNDRYIIYPEHQFWSKKNNLHNKAKPVPEGFNYNSKDNKWRLSRRKMRDILLKNNII